MPNGSFKTRMADRMRRQAHTAVELTPEMLAAFRADAEAEGDPTPDEPVITHAFDAGKPVVVWRLRGKSGSARILRLYITPNGWHLLGDRFAVNGQPTTGIDRLLPLDITEWPVADRFQVGHGGTWGYLAVAQVLDAVRTLRGRLKSQHETQVKITLDADHLIP